MVRAIPDVYLDIRCSPAVVTGLMGATDVDLLAPYGLLNNAHTNCWHVTPRV